jgi:hypothetical protein
MSLPNIVSMVVEVLPPEVPMGKPSGQLVGVRVNNVPGKPKIWCTQFVSVVITLVLMVCTDFTPILKFGLVSYFSNHEITFNLFSITN